MAAKTKPKPKPPRKPEEVWYDVHKHPEGVPGGMGKAPEHHLRQRGWQGHEINEGAGRKTIQYRNMKHPDFVVSYGGGTPQKPDHNFRVLYMGGNPNIPKVTRAYSVAEAMNKVEELHQLHSGLVVQPMIHGASHEGWELPGDALVVAATYGTQTPSLAQQPYISEQHTFVAPKLPPSWQDMTDDDEHPIGPPKTEFPTKPDREHDWPKKQKQLQEIPDPPKPKPPATSVKYADSKDAVGKGIDRAVRGPARTQNEHGTLAGRNRHKASGEAVCPLCRKASTIYEKDRGLYRDLIEDAGGLTDDHMRTTSHLHDRIQDALTPRQGASRRHPEGLGPADLGRAEYHRQWKGRQRAKDDADVSQLAHQYGMDISPEEVPRYPGLRRAVSVFQMAQQETWEE